MQNGDNQKTNEKLLGLVREAIRLDGQLREKYQIGDRFRFIRDRLNALLVHTEEYVAVLQKKTEQKQSLLGENEVLVYVHLFNSQGMVLQTWQKMVVPSVFYDHSVNRPIYADKETIESFVRSKTTKAQHAFLTIAVEKTAILKSAETSPPKDTIGGLLVKVKDGSLKFNRLVTFTHNGHEFVVNENGELIKKKESQSH